MYTCIISKLQNRIIKIITKSNPREKVLPRFKKHVILTLDNLFTYETAALCSNIDQTKSHITVVNTLH